ncbi:MAG: hypothetical protein H6753_03025 [Candidatus Omnitrophica bacterium]|nr:hypothetical protein [Candidatus Omnitrophota bacterium]
MGKITEKIFRVGKEDIPYPYYLGIIAAAVILLGRHYKNAVELVVVLAFIFVIFILQKRSLASRKITITEEKIHYQSKEAVGSITKEIKFKDVKAVSIRRTKNVFITIEDDAQTINIFGMEKMDEISQLIKERVSSNLVNDGVNPPPSCGTILSLTYSAAIFFIASCTYFKWLNHNLFGMALIAFGIFIYFYRPESRSEIHSRHYEICMSLVAVAGGIFLIFFMNF